VLPTAPGRHVRSSPSGENTRHTTASLLIARLRASGRPSTLAKALHEYGRLVRTIYIICRYVADEELRRRYVASSNKGESLHALRRDLFFAHQGDVRRRLGDQSYQALCLTLVTNAGILWTTDYPTTHSTSRCDRRAISAWAD